MAVQIFRLRNVPEDEANEIRQLLTAHQIDFYETPAGNWGISMPAFWLKNENQKDNAKALIASYEQQRQQKAQANPIKLNTWQIFSDNPLRFTLYLLMMVLIIYASLIPFFNII